MTRASQVDHNDNANIISHIDEILDDVRCGKPVIIVDDEDRENEGDLIIAAHMATPENINFMAKFGRGLICLPMEQKLCDRLGLELVGRGDNTHHRTAFTVSIEAKEGVTTGISAADRAKTIQTAIHPDTTAHDIATPGHVFPLIARDGGVLVRAGHTEAAVDLAKMAGFSAAGVICEVMNDDGTMARLNDLKLFAQEHDLKIGTIADLIAYRRQHEKLVHKVHEQMFESLHGGTFTMHIYKSDISHVEHIALVKGQIGQKDKPDLVRMHALNVIQDALGGDQDLILQRSMKMIAHNDHGVVVVIRESDPQLLSRSLSKDMKDDHQSHDHDDGKQIRQYGVGAQILRDLGVSQMVLITNQPKTVVGLEGYGLEIIDYKKC